MTLDIIYVIYFLYNPYFQQNLASNHRANDAIALEGSAQIVTARFTYGPLDVAALTGEKVGCII